MPDAQGNFKGIRVSAEAWERIFYEVREEGDAKARGCICRWVNGRPVGVLPECPLGMDHLA